MSVRERVWVAILADAHKSALSQPQALRDKASRLTARSTHIRQSATWCGTNGDLIQQGGKLLGFCEDTGKVNSVMKIEL